MGKLLVQPTEGKLLADLYLIEGSSINQCCALYPSKVRTVSRAKDCDLRLQNEAHELPLLTYKRSGAVSAVWIFMIQLLLAS